MAKSRGPPGRDEPSEFPGGETHMAPHEPLQGDLKRNNWADEDTCRVPEDDKSPQEYLGEDTEITKPFMVITGH
jgi:hypothetical protein